MAAKSTQDGDPNDPTNIDPTTGLPYTYTPQPVGQPQTDPNAPPPSSTTSPAGGFTFLGQPALPVGNVTGGGTTWSGAAPQSAADYQAMISAATTTRGGPMQDPSTSYWMGVAPDFQSRYGSDWANQLFQHMLGQEASGAAAAPAGPYSAANGYVYTPSQPIMPAMAAPAVPTTGSLGVPASSGVQDTSWMNSTPPAPGWVAVPGVGWVPPDNPAAQGYQASQPASSTAATDPNSSASIDSAYRAGIMNLLNTPQTVDAASLQNDPAVAAYRLAQSRSADQQRAQAVESAVQGGTYSRAPDVTSELTRGIDQRAAESTAGFVGTVALNKMQQNRDALQQGIADAQASGQFAQAQALQEKLANLQASIQEAQIAQQGTLGQGALTLQGQSQANQLQEFLDSLGFNYASLGANLNQSAVLALLNGAGG